MFYTITRITLSTRDNISIFSFQFGIQAQKYRDDFHELGIR